MTRQFVGALRPPKGLLDMSRDEMYEALKPAGAELARVARRLQHGRDKTGQDGVETPAPTK